MPSRKFVERERERQKIGSRRRKAMETSPEHSPTIAPAPPEVQERVSKMIDASYLSRHPNSDRAAKEISAQLLIAGAPAHNLQYLKHATQKSKGEDRFEASKRYKLAMAAIEAQRSDS